MVVLEQGRPLIQYDWCPDKGRRGTEIKREDTHVTAEAEMTASLSPAKGHFAKSASHPQELGEKRAGNRLSV